MLSIAHCATGAVLAVTLKDPVLVIPAVLASHYVLDWIPHWDVGTGLSNGSRKKRDAFVFELGDLALAGLLVIAMYPAIPFINAELSYSTILPFFGAFLGLVPDFIEAPRNFFGWNPWFLKPLNRFHHAVHRSTPNMLKGLSPQIALLIFLWIVR